jgi:hypothetical protein
MSSVLRFLKQTPSNTLVTVASTSLYKYSDIQTAVDAKDAEYVAHSVILIPSQSDLEDLSFTATAADSAVGANVALKDMGERVYIGVAGGDSEQIVFALVQKQGANASGVPAYVCVQNNVPSEGGPSVTVVRGGF